MSSISIRTRSTAAARHRRPVAELSAAPAAGAAPGVSPTRAESRARGGVHQGLRAVRGVAWIGLVAYAAHSVLHMGGAALGSFFEDWLFNALFAVAALVCLARASRGSCSGSG